MVKQYYDLARRVRAGGLQSRMSRRSMLRGGLAAGVGMGALMSRPRWVYSSENDHPLRGETIDMNILGIAGWVPSALSVEMAEELFTEYAREKYGYTPRFDFRDSPFGDMFQRAATSLATGSQDYNIIISDSQWLGAFSEPGWIVPVNPIIEENPELDIEWYSPVLERSYQEYPEGTGEKWGFPQVGDTLVMYVRKDLLENEDERSAFRERYDMELPRTFEDFEELSIDDYEKICEFFTRPDDDLYGTLLQQSREYDFFSMFVYPFMFSTGGDIFDKETWQVDGLLNSESNARALERMVGFLQYQPSGAINYGIAEVIDAFTQGRAFSAWQWAAVGPAMLPEDMADRVMIVPPPAFPQSDGSLRRQYCVGGQPWVINAFNNDARMRVALDYMKWWYLPEVQLEYARRGGCPSDRATLESPGFEDIQPWFRAYKYMMRNNRNRDTFKVPQYAELLSIQQEAFTSYATGQTESAQQALDYAACRQQDLMHSVGTAASPAPPECGDIEL